MQRTAVRWVLALAAVAVVLVSAERAGAFDGGCPPGYVNCNGACLPDCDPRPTGGDGK